MWSRDTFFKKNKTKPTVQLSGDPSQHVSQFVQSQCSPDKMNQHEWQTRQHGVKIKNNKLLPQMISAADDDVGGQEGGREREREQSRLTSNN